jgi:hypothetical protein
MVAAETKFGTPAKAAQTATTQYLARRRIPNSPTRCDTPAESLMNIEW